MAIEILERGTPPNEKKITFGCQSCNSKLRCGLGDGKVTYLILDGAFVTVSCPVCSYNINIDVKKFQ